MSFMLLLLFGFGFGIGFGYFTQRAGLCIAHGLGEIFIGRGKRFLRLIMTIFFITSLGFVASGFVHPELGLRTIGQLRGFGFYNLLSGILFGAGIFINGGCILGTLRQIGEGSFAHIISILAFIPGLALVIYVLNPILEPGYRTQNILLPEMIGVPALYVTLVLAGLSLLALWRLNRKTQ